MADPTQRSRRRRTGPARRCRAQARSRHQECGAPAARRRQRDCSRRDPPAPRQRLDQRSGQRGQRSHRGRERDVVGRVIWARCRCVRIAPQPRQLGEAIDSPDEHASRCGSDECRAMVLCSDESERLIDEGRTPQPAEAASRAIEFAGWPATAALQATERYLAVVAERAGTGPLREWVDARVGVAPAASARRARVEASGGAAQHGLHGGDALFGEVAREAGHARVVSRASAGRDRRAGPGPRPGGGLGRGARERAGPNLPGLGGEARAFERRA